MSKMKITEKDRHPASVLPRVFVWSAAVVAMPFTGGASLLGGVFMEVATHIEKKRASEELDRLDPDGYNRASQHLNEQINRGAQRGTYSYSARTDGWGTVCRTIEYKEED